MLTKLDLLIINGLNFVKNCLFDYNIWFVLSYNLIYKWNYYKIEIKIIICMTIK